MFDCVIIGTGAAGISAALSLKLLKRNFILLGSRELSPKITAAEKIKNYPGLAAASGEQLKNAFLSQLDGEGIEIVNARVNGVYPVEEGYVVTCGESEFKTQTVIIATGVEAVKPVKGEREFLGRGVSYCATCDGFLYKGKRVAVAVESEEQLHEVELLRQYAQEVYLLSLTGNISGAMGRLVEIKGAMRVNEIMLAAGEQDSLKVDGVFVLKDAVAAETLVHGLKTEGGAVAVNRDMSTNLAGVYAAGDITGRPYQYAKAVGEGNVAAHSVNAYLNAKYKA